MLLLNHTTVEVSLGERKMDYIEKMFDQRLISAGLLKVLHCPNLVKWSRKRERKTPDEDPRGDPRT